MMIHNLNIKPLLLALAAPVLVSVADAQSHHINAGVDEGRSQPKLARAGDLEQITPARIIDTFMVFSRYGDQVFTPGNEIETELDGRARHSSLGDLDGDGDLDLVTSEWSAYAFTVFLGKGDGTFGPGIQVDTELDEFANHTSLGDLDGDGDLDLVTSALGADAFTVFLGNGDGTFGPGRQIDTELDEGATHSSLGDLDGDGDLDLVTSAAGAGAFTVFLNSGDSTFGPGRQIDTELDEGATHSSLGDLDGDGNLDLVTSARGANAFTVFLGNGDGTFGQGAQIHKELDESAKHSSLGDLDGDGDLDLVSSASDSFTVFLGNGDGTFGPGSQIDTRRDKSANHTSLGDLDGDGNLDLITSSQWLYGFTLFWGNGDGTFGPGRPIETAADEFSIHSSLGDLDGDGDLDLVTSAFLFGVFKVHLNE